MNSNIVHIKNEFYKIDGTSLITAIKENFSKIMKSTVQQHQPLSVKFTTQYVDGILPDETNFYSLLDGDNFIKSYESLEGYALVGMNVRSYPDIDGDTQIIHNDEVKEGYEIIIKLDRAEYNVTVTVQYPEGTIENQVFIYSALYGDSFEEFIEIALGYRIAAIQTEKGVDVNFQTQIIEIESVKKDMLITIICR